MSEPMFITILLEELNKSIFKSLNSWRQLECCSLSAFVGVESSSNQSVRVCSYRYIVYQICYNIY